MNKFLPSCLAAFLGAGFLGVGLLAAGPLDAEEFAPVTGTVLQGWTNPDGSRTAAIELRLEKGWKTYWRVPGDAGIPPLFDWGKSQNLAHAQPLWPTPKVFSQGGMRTLGYENSVVIPLRIDPKTTGKAVRLRARMDIGICRDICAPYALDFDAVLDGTSGRPTPAIAAALAQLPFSARDAGVRGATCALTPINDGLRIEARVRMPAIGTAEVMVIEAGDPAIWVSEADTRRSGDTLIATADMMLASGKGFALDRSRIRITVIGGGSSVDLTGCEAG